MYNHAPPGYICPFCLLIQGKENIQTELKQTDIVFQAADSTAFMATKKYPNNQGHVLVIPNEHFENIYDLPLALSAKIHLLGRDIALAMKAEYQCDGIMLRQHNEPAGDQNIWHYHLHVIPRYQNDNFHSAQKAPFPASERAKYAQKLRNWFSRSEESLMDEIRNEKY
jgi:histidine triad (HIT) family protein